MSAGLDDHDLWRHHCDLVVCERWLVDPHGRLQTVGRIIGHPHPAALRAAADRARDGADRIWRRMAAA